MELSGYLAVAKRWWWTLLVATWVAAVSGYVFASQIPPTYESRVQLLVGPYNTDTDTLRAAGQLVQTYAELVTTQPLLESAVAEVGSDISPSELGANTRVVANDTTRFLTIRVQGTDPEEARDLANALADEIILLASRGTTRPEGQLQVVDFATTPQAPIAPQVSLIVGLAALAAMLGAMVLVMLVEYLSPTIRTKEDLARLTGLPLLGQLDILRSPPSDARALADRAPESQTATAYRLVAAKLSFSNAETATRSVAIVGPGPQTANAQVAANLAAIVAHGGRQVILVDGDPTQTTITRIHDLVGRRGLAEALADPTAELTSSLHRVTRTLRVMPIGSSGDSDSMDADRAGDLLVRLAGFADLVIVATGPLHLSAGALGWARAVDAAVLVAVRDETRRDDVTYVIESLRLVAVDVVGAVLADRRRSLGRPSTRSTGREAPMAIPIDEPIDERPLMGDPPTAPQPTSRRRGKAGETTP